MNKVHPAKLFLWPGRPTMQGLRSNPGKCCLVVATLQFDSPGRRLRIIVWILFWAHSSTVRPTALPLCARERCY